MEISITFKSGIHHLSVSGTLTTCSLQKLKQRLKQIATAKQRHVWIHCGKLKQVVPEALENLPLYLHWLEKRKISLLLLCLNPELQTLLVKSQLDVVLPSVQSEAIANMLHRP